MGEATRAPASSLPLPLAVSLGATIALAWLAIAQAGASPFAHYLHGAHMAGPGHGLVPAAATFVTGWTVMTIAMMLPTTLPLIGMFGRVVAARSDRGVLVALVCVGYLLVWLGAGVIGYALAVAMRAAAARLPWLDANPWAIGSASLVLAGAFQFSAVKYACLDRCRSTFGFINEHWTGRAARADAFRLGAHHGLFCVGCCWALMLLMIPMGAGHLGWMLLLGAAMAIEKNVSWGRALVRPLGVALIVAGASLAVWSATQASGSTEVLPYNR